MEKRRLMVLGALVVLSLSSIIFVGTAYSNGKNVIADPEVTWVSHTEYWSGDDVSTIVRLTDYRGDAYDNVQDCIVTIKYPDKSNWVVDANMAQSTVAGNWYHTEVVPYIQGTYEQEVTCTYGAGKTVKTSQSFHVNPALTQIQNISADILSETALLTDVHTSVTAQITSTNETIAADIASSETTITDLVNTVDTDLTNQMTALGSDIDSDLIDVNASISGQLGETQVSIETNLGNTETTLSNLMTTLNGNLQSYLTVYLTDINNTANLIYTDTQWLSLNAMNQEDATEIQNRFDSIDNNLAVIEDFCSNSQTNVSDLCGEVSTLNDIVDAMRAEQTTYYLDLNQTTLSTWNLLSGDIATNLDAVLISVGIIQSQTTEINETLSQIRQEQLEEIRIYTIS
ncbi:hypothetical protein HN510_02065 [Candidatus Woesearchaeota archaeon]|nr:hypothetical protein [Candidatus Woesearchaeota archaeon]